ncbi:MAG TPA: hypothetical protein VG675_13980 [Bryobacteraceae bacterium]|nr:hypothetical protein [Bryobacteraceae bacterium]
MSREPYFVGFDLRDESTVTNLLDCIAGFPVFVDGLRKNGSDDHGVTAAIGDLMNLVQQADKDGEDLRLLGALAPDLLYIRVSELLDFDRWTRVYAGMAPQLLLDQLRVRGVSSFYILDNSIREDRFDALVKIFSDVGYSVISPNLDGLTEAEVLNRIDGAQILRKHILYVERDASVNYLDAVREIQKRPWYTVAFRDQAPTMNSVEILQLARSAKRE